MRKAIIIGTIAGVMTQGVVAEEAPLEIKIEGGSSTGPGTMETTPEALPPIMPLDDALRILPGVSGSRMGGHGTDLVIRGQGKTSINVLLDGAYVHGGCPNRMDPPLAYAPSESYDKITVIKGSQTVIYGSGGSGGSVILERETPRFFADEKFRAKATAGYRSNSNTGDASVDVAAGSEKGFARLLGSYMDAGNYKDGNGESVRSAFTESAGTAILGYTPDDHTRLELSYEAQRTRDVLFAGAGMDSPISDADTVRLKFEKRAIGGVLDAIKAEFYRADVEHVMDNYTLRKPANPMMLMRAPSTSDTTGGRIIVDVGDVNASGLWKLGVDVQNNERDAVRVNDFNGMLNSVLWPGADIDQAGLFAEYHRKVDDNNRFTGGLRYDRVTANASKADKDPMGMPMSPNQLYTIYYDDTTASKKTEHNWGGLLRWEHDFDSTNGYLYGGISRSVRTADATERFIASNAAMPSMRWVGNPDIDPEKSHQLDIGVVLENEKWDLDASIFYNNVDDFILRDRFHAPMNNATIYRNVDATLLGGELNLNYRWTNNWSSNFGLSYVYAQNDTDDRAIAQIPPLEFIASLDYGFSSWDLGGRVRGAAKQTRVDSDPLTGSGLDVQQTPAWAVLDLYGSYHFNNNTRLRFGVENVFDKNYAQHLNRSSAFDPLQVQVNEPGISAYVQLAAKF